MAKQNQTDTEVTTEAVNDKPKRKQLTPEERVAKLEAELEAARKRAEERGNKRANQLKEKQAKLIEKRDALTEQINQIQDELDGPTQLPDDSQNLVDEGKA